MVRVSAMELMDSQWLINPMLLPISRCPQTWTNTVITFAILNSLSQGCKPIYHQILKLLFPFCLGQFIKKNKQRIWFLQVLLKKEVILVISKRKKNLKPPFGNQFHLMSIIRMVILQTLWQSINALANSKPHPFSGCLSDYLSVEPRQMDSNSILDTQSIRFYCL